jgi:fructan beta-fructosidase
MFSVMKCLFSGLLIAVAFGAASQNNLGKEIYRPQFHFTPIKNWMNDPNGLVYFEGNYHLYYQYNPFGNVWGHMSWGHAVSKDLLHWEHLPLAIREENGIMIFSGSAVRDENNGSGFAEKPGQVPMVAIYSGHFIPDTSKRDDYQQAQYIAFSLDRGRTWKKYDNNPVLDIHKKDFRDPKVFWYAPENKWVMAVVWPHEHIVQFYSSSDLKKWVHLSDFGPAGDTHDIWECTDLLEVPVTGQTGKTKWVLFNSQQVTMQYFVGSFDGNHFKNENPGSKIYRPDWGPDYYAGITYNQLPAGELPVLVGWANNWTYANDIPTFPWKGTMALPRRLSLQRVNDEWILFQQPVTALKALRRAAWESKSTMVNGKKIIPVKSQQCEIEFTIHPPSNGLAGLRLATGKVKSFVIGYDAANHKLFIDRSGAGKESFNAKFGKLSKYEAHLTLHNGQLKLHVYFDNSIVEVFANEGEVVMTAQFFPEKTNNGMELFSERGRAEITGLRVWTIQSVW